MIRSGAAPRLHDDPGLQPERTVMAWGRTMLSLFVVSTIFLKWMPYYGWRILALTALAGTAALFIYASQRRRYRNQSVGVATGRVRADAAAALWTTSAVVFLGVLAIVMVAQ